METQNDPLSDAIRQRATRHQAPRQLVDTITQMAAQQATSGTPKHDAGASWLDRLLGQPAKLAAAFMSGAVAASLTMAVLIGSPQRDDAALVDAHLRSLLDTHLFDVASTDQHTVKPWFAGRLDYAPVVYDFASDGYPLAGGRLDVFDGRRVAALVFMRRQHRINLFELPASKASAAPKSAPSERGFNLVAWSENGVHYVAVSDLAAPELLAFAEMFWRRQQHEQGS
jgi:anti-sigma factor RsiW